MAYASVVSLIETLEEIRDGHEILYNKEQIECLLSKVSFLQTFLEDFSQKNSKEVKELETQIRDAAYAAQNMIDSYISNQLLSMCECCVDRSYTVFCEELQRVVENFDSAKLQVMEFRNMGSKNLAPKNSFSAGSLRLASGGKNSMVGFVDEMLQIKDRLTGQPSYKLDVISIVGMGGSGKTTLARSMYDDAFIVYHFYTRAWVTISQEYHLREILLGLLMSMKKLTGKKCEDSYEELAEYLYKSLKGRRYLIVLDDMWDIQVWNEIKLLFPDDGNGSRIILTSRISDVALYASSNSPPYNIRFLNNNESWDLLKEKVFQDENCPTELEGLGKKIARSCQGLPLAILLVGGLLAKIQRTQNHWRNVAENVPSIISTHNDQCLEILSLSYNHLPQHLKMCFLYMGVFPEDYQIPVSKLIRLWAAEGFLKPCGDESLDDVGEKYLQDLIDRSIVLVSKRKLSGKIRTCSIHDLVRDLCVREAQKEKFIRTIKTDDDLSSEDAFGYRRLCLHSSILHDDASFRRDSVIAVREHSDGRLKEIYDAMRSSPLIHCLIFTGTYHKPLNIFLRFGLLRVLDALSVTFFWFPIEVLELVNLRHLALTFDGELPRMVSDLQNLEILIVHQVFWGPLSYLPLEIWRMPRLRHLEFKEVFFPNYPGTLYYGKNTFSLENLQTLVGIRDFRVTEDVYKSIPNVKKLEIVYDKNSNTTEWSLYCLDNLVHLHQLESLKCHFLDAHRQKPDLPDLTFPSKLKELSLLGWEIPSKYMTTIGSLHNLEILKLRFCSLRDDEWELSEGEFYRLKILVLEGMNIVQWRAEADHFPSLEQLIIKHCRKLEEIPPGFGDIPTLQLIKVVEGSRSCESSAMQILEDQQSLGNYGLKVIT
ncbi:putative late blight resistance protein homolog R1A-10 isoform X1 [Sesamum indicum]|uniref:Late blight resistance protein homolog R1A-10 isoform X1 n=1 Tax=Sesamum indicum TaxID=4182 RepID=A0A6I9TIK1_SESIN|nr:putative late blight resistance protein homolog R1A-10 isoform X1 [Sesamum indicum]